MQVKREQPERALWFFVLTAPWGETEATQGEAPGPVTRWREKGEPWANTVLWLLWEGRAGRLRIDYFE